MIKIISTSEVVGDKVKYIVMVDEREITTFYLSPSDGIGRRLLEASKAVERQEWEKLRAETLEEFALRKSKKGKRKI